MTTGQRIAAKRKELELSQEGLGERLGVSRQSIYKWESDASLPEIDKLVALSRLFNVPVGWLLGVEEENAQGSDPLSEEQLHMIEEIFRRYQQQAEPKELSEEQRRQVEEMVSKGTSGKGKSPWDKWSVRILFGMCGAIVASVFTINAKVDNFQNQYSDLSYSIENITSSVHGQIGSLTGRVEEILKAQNSLTADYSAQFLSADLAKNTVTFDLRVVPKTYMEGMTVTFLADYGNGSQEAEGQPGEGQAFTARLTCPLTDVITLSVIFTTGDTKQTQLLDSFANLYTNSLPDATLSLGGELLDVEQNKDGAFSLPAVWGILLCDSIGIVGPLTERSEAVSAQVGLFRNKELVCWLEKDVENPSDYSNTSAQVAVVSREENDFCSYYALPEMTLEAEEGDAIEFAALITDQYGRQFMCQDFGFVVQNGTLEYPEYTESSSNPADWTFS